MAAQKAASNIERGSKASQLGNCPDPPLLPK
jgi:hypothetical protein